MGLSGAKALEEWCRVSVSGYPGVNITNMSSAWRDGRAFCAVIHRYAPHLIDWARVERRDWAGNCKLAFEIAEKELGIPALLDVEDVVNHRSPDRLSILTYLSQYYHKFSYSGPDSGISSLSQSPASSDSEAESSGVCSSSAEKRGAILSLMDGRRVRSVSCHARRRGRSEGGRAASPPIEQDNPFRCDFDRSSIAKLQDWKQVKTSPSKQLIEKVKNISAPVMNVNLRQKHSQHYTEPRMVQSMYVESNKDFSLPFSSFQSSTNSRPSLITTAIPRPYTNTDKTQNLVSILSKTQTIIQERKKRSQSQPPEKRKKFEFLSTSNYLPLQTTKSIHPNLVNQKNIIGQVNIKCKEDSEFKKLDFSNEKDHIARKSCDKSSDTKVSKYSDINYKNHRPNGVKSNQTKQIHQVFNFKEVSFGYPQAFRQTLV